MRPICTLHPTDQIPAPPDTVNTILLTGGSSAQAMDWPAGTQIARITPMTTAGAAFYVMANLGSTAAAVPSSGSTVGTTALPFVNHPITGQMAFQIPGASTGFSVAAFTSGYAIVECWRK